MPEGLLVVAPAGAVAFPAASTGASTAVLLAALLTGCSGQNDPAGSVKDRIARAMIDDAEAKGLLKPGSVIMSEHNRLPII